jgi:hypothetical protein
MNKQANLKDLAKQANHAHQLVSESLRTAIDNAKNAGDLLIEAKSLVEHGDWTQWIGGNFKASPETARIYMRVSKNWDYEVKPALESNPDLTLEDVKRILRRELPKCGTALPSQPPHKVLKSALQKNFQKWIDDLPDEAIECLVDKWQAIFLGIYDLLILDEVEFDETETPVHPHTVPGIQIVDPTVISNT